MSSSPTTNVSALIFEFPSRPKPRVSSISQCAGYGITCKHRVVWRIIGEGYYCNTCYDSHLAAHYRDIDVLDIRRLSDREQDFYASNGGK